MVDAQDTRIRELVRTTWTRTAAYVASRFRTLQASARDASGYGPGMGDLGTRVSHAARQSVSDDVDYGEDVSLAELLEHAEPESPRRH